MAGDVVAAVAAPMLAVPVLVVKSYECPAFVDAGSLVFAVSASGNTEETLQAAADAAAPGATMVVISGRRASWPSWPRRGTRRSSACPPRSPSPGPASGPWRSRPLVVLEEMGLYRGGQYWIDAAVDQLKRRRDELAGAGESSAAAAMARRIGRTIPLDPRRREPSAPPPPSAGRPRSTRTPRRRPSGAPSPSCATTRCAAGASTAT